MPEATNITALLVGGGLALAGTVVSQAFGLLSGLIDRKHQTELRHKKRLEEMMALVSVSLVWFHRLSGCRTTEQYQATFPPPEHRQLVMLARLSFPSVVEPARLYANACIQHYGFAADCFRPDVPASVGAQMALAVRNHPELSKDHEAIVVLRNRLDDAIAEEAKKYFHV